MKNIFSVFVLFIVAAGCTKQATTAVSAPLPPPPPPPTATAKTWLALGDSYTIGQNVSATERFPAQTISLLNGNGLNIAAADYIATTGWTTDNLLSVIANQNPAPHDVVSLLIGVNDQYQRRDTTGYRDRFTQLLEKSITLANRKTDHVFVVSIPDYSVTPFAASSDTAAIRKQIDQFNAINKEVTLSYKIAYLDITPGSREAKNNSSLIANDGLHPSGLEYKKWADRLAPLVKTVIQ